MAGANVFVVPADAEDFDATVASTVTVEGEDAPGALAGQEAVRVWGLRDGDEALFEAMESGDVVLFYRDGRYVGVGTVGTTFRDEAGWVADGFWDDGDAGRLFTVEEFERVDLSRAAVHAIFDYSANYYPSTPMQVPDDRVDNSAAAIHAAIVRYDRERGG